MDLTRAARAAPVLALAVALAGCFDATEADPDGARLAADAGPSVVTPVPPPRATELDLLLQIDGSNSLTEEHYAFFEQLPFLLEALSAGDFDGDGVPDGEPFRSIQVGVVTADMGTGGAVVPTCERPRFGDDGVLETGDRFMLPACAGPYPSFLTLDRPQDSEPFAEDLLCVANVGTGGCGFEQPLEALLKALSPSEATGWTAPGYTAPTFFGDAAGHGDGENRGFDRGSSMLAIVSLTDEDDCSARDVDLYDPDSDAYRRTDLNLRCHRHPDALHPVSRYVDGLLQLRGHPDRLAFFLIAGIPRDLQPDAGARPDFTALAGAPEVRDPRMVERVDPSNPSRVEPSCNTAGLGVALPPVRMAQAAAALDAAGARVGVGSICTADDRPAIEALLALLGR